VSDRFKRVLIVDDEAVVAETTRRILMASAPSLEIMIQTSSEEAIRTLQETPAAVLLCDLQMPVMDGVQVMKAAHEVDPHIVSILITAFATKEGVIRAMNEGYTWRCVEKPWDPTALTELVLEGTRLYYERSAASSGRAAAPAMSEPEPPPKPKPATPAPARQSGKGKLIIRKSKPVKKKLVPKKRVSLNKPAASSGPKPAKKVRYQNLVLIKRGGSGSIYRADDSLLGLPVAIKVISDSFAKDEASMAMLFDEARIAMGLSHKHIVRLHNIEESRGSYQLVMEYIEGSTFRDILDESGHLPLDMVLQIVEICEDALGYAHRRKVFHRDLKPDNIMLSENGVLKIIDFGLSCLAEKQRKSENIEGTPYYISPEEIRGDAIDHRGDIFSLGVLIHEFILGHLPHHAGGAVPEDVFEYQPAASPELPGDLQAVLQKSFAPDPDNRWQDIHAFSAAFRSALG
jgi:CheY-like chemotaxis protein